MTRLGLTEQVEVEKLCSGDMRLAEKRSAILLLGGQVGARVEHDEITRLVLQFARKPFGTDKYVHAVAPAVWLSRDRVGIG